MSKMNKILEKIINEVFHHTQLGPDSYVHFNGPFFFTGDGVVSPHI